MVAASVSSAWKPKPVRRLTAAGYFRRAFGYGAIAAMSLGAGALMRPGQLPPAQWTLLTVPAGFSLFFALCYAICFHRDHGSIRRAALNAPQQNAIVGLAFVITLLVAYVAVDGYWHASASMPPASVLAGLIGHASVCLSYGLFLIGRMRYQPEPLMRHLLIWPAVLSVAAMLFVGMYLNTLQTSLAPGVPVSALLLFIAVVSTLGCSKRQLFLATAGVVFVTTVVLALPPRVVPSALTDVIPLFGRLLFALAVAAYLAVFESWRITSLTAQREGQALLMSALITDQAQPKSPRSYYVASLMALTIATWAVPLFYVFSDVGTLFIVVFAFHALAAFGWWTGRGVTPEQLQQNNWILAKNTFGFAFLGILVVDANMRRNPDAHLLPQFMYWGIPALELALVNKFLVDPLRSDENWKGARVLDSEGLALVFSRRMNAVRLLGLLSWFGSLALVLAQHLSMQPGSLAVHKIDIAILVYGSFIAVALVAELWNEKGPKGFWP